MYVCVCKAVRSKEVAELIESGAKTIEAIGMSCGAGTDCGSCVRRIQNILKQTESSNATQIQSESCPEKKAV